MDDAKANNSKSKKTLSVIANILIWIFIAFSVVITVLALSMQATKDGVPSIAGKVMSPVLSDSMSPTFNKDDMIFSSKLSDKAKTELELLDVVSFKTDLDKDGNPEVNTHRIVEVIGSGDSVQYRTKGDHESFNDNDLIVPADVISVVNKKSVETLDENKKASLKKNNIFEATVDGETGYYLVKEVVKEGGNVVSYKAKAITGTGTEEYDIPVAQVTAKLNEKISRAVGLGGFIKFLMQPTGFFFVIVLPLILFFLFEIVMFVRKILEVKNAGKKQITIADEEMIKQRAIEEYIRQQQMQQQNTDETPENAGNTAEIAENTSENAGEAEAPKDAE